ncbi:oxygen-insensitive NADPH nitroreductase [Planococcus sp. CPCC 101016]|uniref:oxygen-insensitive NADPH nitroreductase n=1 Tax=Planococcus sp. CPCC 101016 TaxID=2599617 RepID=UPI0021BDE1D7|nr:oxygen-insensitive NADPH nitroreductase [Planococcus sp. CPCC 101016]
MEKPEMIQLIESHRSIRKFQDKPIEEGILETILLASRWAPTSHNMQAYSIITIKNPESKDKLSVWCGKQRYVKECPVFLVICADFYRLHIASEMHSEKAALDEIENVIVGAVDAALVAENILLASRACGLGGVMIGGIRNNPEAVSDLLNLPKYVFPVMGMCLGYPDQNPWQKPRMPVKAVFHEEKYQTNLIPKALHEYDAIISEYYSLRTNGIRTSGWTEQLSSYISTPRRKELSDFLRKKGFDLK